MLTSPVLELQRQAGANVGEAYGWRLPSTYSSLAEESEAATRRVGVLDRSYVGRLKLTGRDGLDLLNRLSTNDLEELTTPGQGTYTVLTSNKGRILDLLFVLRLEDHLLMLTGAENRQKVADWIDFYTFTEDVAIRDETEETAMLAVMGPNAASLLDNLTGEAVSALPRYGSVSARIGGIEVLVIRTDFARLPGYDIAVSSAQAGQLWTQLLSMGAELGVKPVGMEALEVVRIEQGVPVYGKELSEDVNPLDANLLEFISFSKGCYVGQEVVARLNTYEKVQKYLVGLSWNLDNTPVLGAGLFLEGKRVGGITSAVKSPRLGKAIGLGYVRKTQAQPGVRLTIESADVQIAAQVEELPFR